MFVSFISCVSLDHRLPYGQQNYPGPVSGKKKRYQGHLNAGMLKILDVICGCFLVCSFFLFDCKFWCSSAMLNLQKSNELYYFWLCFPVC